MRTLAFSVLLLATTFAGCVDTAPLPNAADTADDVLSLLAGPALWSDPQNTPHPAYGWATLSSPAVGDQLPAYWAPIAAKPLPETISGLEHIVKADGVEAGAGIAMFGSLAIVPGFGAPSSIVDISDPAKPVLLSTFKPQEGMASHRGATTIAYPDGRLVTVIATGRGLDVWDISDPTSPQPLPTIVMKSHKVGVVPGTPIVYNAASGGGGSRIADEGTAVTEIYDLSDPTNPVKVQDWANGFACHHVYFWNDIAQEKYRGICAGIEFTQIWDTKDPKDPKVIVSVPVHQGVAGTPSGSIPLLAFSHYAGLSRDGKILLVGDESGGGSYPPGCVASVNTPAGAVSTPVGALWFYDVSNEKSPKVLGWYSPLNDPRVKAAPDTSCTAHHGRLVPAEGRDMIAMSFYGAGVVLVDFTGVGTASGPLAKVVAQYADGSDTWETWYNQGYLFTGDLARGMDVITFK